MYKAIRDWWLEPPKPEDEWDAIVKSGEIAVEESMKKAEMHRRNLAELQTRAQALNLSEFKKAALKDIVTEASDFTEEVEVDKYIESAKLPENKRTALKGHLITYLHSRKRCSEDMTAHRAKQKWYSDLPDYAGMAAGGFAGLYFESTLGMILGTVGGGVGVNTIRTYYSGRRPILKRFYGETGNSRGSALAILRE